ncbi:hypothetical protein C8A03DRAFT_13705 [Achaetomium macrosporum]|uniref:RING-type domain-containing protein n=1 Tax=Achaetomium macrosporum TaxID=79813 RepID=A0AAN7CDC2_9PEZI|nr:hypothetical protein C8A03DRAFT_13705 [Achaetomium macrosporum]
MTEACKACHGPLTLTLDPEESGDEGLTVPDDLVLPCGCHFHWQCLLDQAAEIASSLSCPSCNRYLPSLASAAAGSSSTSTPPSLQQTPILTTYTNEGGMQEDLDISPILFEEAFLSSHPEARPARAFHTLASEGDMQGMVELLRDLDENVDDDSPVTASQLLVWRDPLNGGRSALHVALEAQQEEVVWLLLWLGSAAKGEDFPPAVVQAAEGMGLARREAGSLPVEEDVRFVRDERGRAAGDVCLELGPPWTRLVEGGLFT